MVQYGGSLCYESALANDSHESSVDYPKVICSTNTKLGYFDSLFSNANKHANVANVYILQSVHYLFKRIKFSFVIIL